MEVIIAVPSTFRNLDVLKKAIARSEFPISVVVSGGNGGLDEEWARANGKPVRRIDLPPRRSGSSTTEYYRALAEAANALIAIWDGKNGKMPGIVRAAMDARLPIFIFSPG